MANLASETIRATTPVKADFDAVQVSMSRLKGRQVTQPEVLEELLKVYRHVAEEPRPIVEIRGEGVVARGKS